MTTLSILDQMPRLSAYDPGAVGEGGLDPLGLSAVADRIANLLAPGIRARMSLPRFITISAVGAIAYQALHELTSDQGLTTVDIAFEWLVVEAMVRHAGINRSQGLPGNQKALRAIAADARLSRRTYLNGPRVFGFTGVYRPFSRNVSVLASDDLPGENAARLVDAWERDVKRPGYVYGVSGTSGGTLRRDLAEACQRTLEKGECAAPPNGRLLRDLAELLAPNEARSNERRLLRELISTGEHEIRNELSARLVADPPSESISQRDLVLKLLDVTGHSTRRALQAAFDFEEAATALDNAFRRFLAHTTQQYGSLIEPSLASKTPGLSETAAKIDALVQVAYSSVAALDDAWLSAEVTHAFQLFASRLTPKELLEALIERHEAVQVSRKKLSWLDKLNEDWTVRVPYRSQTGDFDDAKWTHPMRVATLARFLVETT